MHSFQCVSKGRDKNECCCSIGVGQQPGAADATSKNAQQGNVLKSEHHLNARKLRLSAATKELERAGGKRKAGARDSSTTEKGE